MSQTIAWLQGKKTYLVAAAALITIAVQYLDGSLDVAAASVAALNALGLATLRAGVAKSS